MKHELWYTSAPRGLALGSAGYCTVKATKGMPPSLKQVLESLSQFEHRAKTSGAITDSNPVVYSSLIGTVTGKKWHILSRICDAGADHTGRTNFFAHHIAYDEAEGQSDPIWLMRQPGFFETAWDQKSEELHEARPIPFGKSIARVCKTWEVITGDAGWAGVIAEAYLEDSEIYLLTNESQHLPSLLSEIVGILPNSSQNEFTFNSHYRALPHGWQCRIRCIAADSEQKRMAVRKGALVVPLSHSAGKPPHSSYVGAAREGFQIGSNAKRSTSGTLYSVEIPSIDTKAPTKSNSMNPTASDTTQTRRTAMSTFRGVSTQEKDSSPWVPVLSALGGLLLSALIMLPLLLWYKSGKETEEHKVMQLNATLNKLENNNAGLKQEIAVLQKEKADATDQYHSDMMAKIKQFQDENNAIAIEKSKLDAEIKTYLEQIQRLENSNSTLQRKLDETTASLAKASTNTKEVEDQTSQNTAKITEISSSTISLLPTLFSEKDHDVINIKKSYIAPLKSRPAQIRIPTTSPIDIVPNESFWHIRNNQEPIAKVTFEEHMQLLTLAWDPLLRRKLANKQELLNISNSLAKAVLEITMLDGQTIQVPLYQIPLVQTPQNNATHPSPTTSGTKIDSPISTKTSTTP